MPTRPTKPARPAAEPLCDVLCIGQATFDIFLGVERQPGPDEKAFAASRLCSGGGPAANASIAVRRLGGTSALAAYLGHDAFGHQHREELAEAGVDTRFLVVGPQPTALSCILVKPGGQRSIVNHPTPAPPLTSSDVRANAVDARVLLFDGHEPEISLALAREARKLGVPTVLDAGSARPGPVSLLKEVTHLVASEKFALAHTRRRDPEEALEILSDQHPSVVITLGPRGLIWARERQQGSMAAFSVGKIVDTTGAGDIFHGAFALGLARKLSFLEILRFASAAGALCCTRPGARTAAPSAEEVAALLNS